MKKTRSIVGAGLSPVAPGVNASLADEALRESERRYRSLFENMTEGCAYCRMLFTDGRPRDFVYLAVNKAFEKQTGLRDVAGRKVSEVLPGIREADPELFERYGRVALTGRPERFETFVQALRMWFSVSVYCPAAEHFVAVFDVIDERKRAEEDLRRSREQLRLALDAANDGLWDWDIPSGRSYYGPRYYTMLDYEVGEFPGSFEAFRDLIHPDDREATLGSIRKSLDRDGGPYAREFRLKTKSGGWCWILSRGKVVERDEEGRAVRMAGTHTDITERKQSESAMRLFRALIDRSEDAVEIVDTATQRFVDVNQSACRNLGYTLEEMLALSVPDVSSTIDRAAFAAKAAELKKTGHVTFDDLHRRKDGTTFPVEVSLSLVTLDREHVLAIVRDVTERRRVEEALRREQELLNSLVSTIPDHIYFKDRQSRFVRINESMARGFGLRSPAEAVGRTDADFFSTEHARQALADEQRVMESGEPRIGIEEKETWPDGRVSWVSTTKVPRRDAGGAIIGLVGISRDITEVKRTAEQVEEQAALLDRASDAIYVRGLDGAISYWNRGAERLYGWPRRAAMGRKLAELNLSDLDDAAEGEAALMREGRWTGERRQVTRTGQQVTVFTRLSVVKDEGGKPVSVFAINTDITEKKQLEARFLQAQRLESLGSLASGIAHDLNNVLAPILLATPLLRAKAQDDSDRRMIASMESSARRGADIVRQVLTFARGAVGERVPVQPRHLLREIGEVASETFPRNIQVEMDFAKDLWPVIGDATQLHQILMNLCINARDAMPQGGTLTVAATNIELDEAFTAMTPGARVGPHICLKVADTGAGIAPENYDRIFEPFFTTKEKGKGTGLGLPTVLGLVKSHGGFVRFHSKVGVGTRFEVFLPANPAAKIAADRNAGDGPPRGDGELILVVDDEIALREVATRILERSGYKVVTAAEGTDALALYLRDRPAVAAVVTDMSMPGMDWPSFIRVLRRIEPAVRILGITGIGETDGLEGIESLALHGLLLKPFTAEVFLWALHGLLHPAPAAASSIPAASGGGA